MSVTFIPDISLRIQQYVVSPGPDPNQIDDFDLFAVVVCQWIAANNLGAISDSSKTKQRQIDSSLRAK